VQSPESSWLRPFAPEVTFGTVSTRLSYIDFEMGHISMPLVRIFALEISAMLKVILLDSIV
jgi:hypothetical protein